MASCSFPSDGPPPLIPISPPGERHNENQLFDKSNVYAQQPASGNPYAKSIAYSTYPADRTQAPAPVQPSGGHAYFPHNHFNNYGYNNFAQYNNQMGKTPGSYQQIQSRPANCFNQPTQNGSQYQGTSYPTEFYHQHQKQAAMNQYAGTFQNYSAYPQQRSASSYTMQSQRPFHVASPMQPCQFAQQQAVLNSVPAYTSQSFSQSQPPRLVNSAPSIVEIESSSNSQHFTAQQTNGVSNKRVQIQEQAEEPVPKMQRLSRDDVNRPDSVVPYRSCDVNKQAPEPVAASSGSPKSDETEVSLKLARFKELVDNPFIIQDIVLNEKKLIGTRGSNHLDIDLSLSDNKYQAIDFVRFHRIVSSGKVSVRVKELDGHGTFVLVTHPSLNELLERYTADYRAYANVIPAVNDLMKPLESMNCFERFAILAFRRPLCWELVGFVGSLHDEQDEKASSGNQEEEPMQNSCPSPSSSEETDADVPNEVVESSVAPEEAANRVESIVESEIVPGEEANQEESADREQLEPSKLFTCQFCDKSFTARKSYATHLYAHKKFKGNFRCEPCNKEFLSRKMYHQHRLTHFESPPRDRNGNQTACLFCKKVEGCSCQQEESDVDLDPETRPIQLVTLEKLRNLFTSGKLCARLSEKHAKTVIVMRPEEEEQFAGDSTDIRLVEDIGRISKIAADLVDTRTLAEYSTRCAMLVFDDELLCWKLAGCLEPQISPSASSDSVESKSEEADPLFSPTRSIDPSSMLECVVENSPEKTVERPPSQPDSGSEADYPAVFSNPLGEQSLEDVALRHLLSMIPQQVNEQIFDLLNMPEAPVPAKKRDAPKKARVCKQCDQVFRDQKSFVEHKLAHNPNLRIHACDQCSYVTVDRSNLKHHAKRHLPKAASA